MPIPFFFYHLNKISRQDKMICSWKTKGAIINKFSQVLAHRDTTHIYAHTHLHKHISSPIEAISLGCVFFWKFVESVMGVFLKDYLLFLLLLQIAQCWCAYQLCVPYVSIYFWALYFYLIISEPFIVSDLWEQWCFIEMISSNYSYCMWVPI